MKRWTLEELVGAAQTRPMLKQYLLSEPLVKPDERQVGSTFTTSRISWGDGKQAEAELREVTTFSRIGLGSGERAGTIAVFNASPEVVNGAIGELRNRVATERQAAERRQREAQEQQKAQAEAIEAEQKRARAEQVAKMLEAYPQLELRVEKDPRLGWCVLDETNVPRFGIDSTLSTYGHGDKSLERLSLALEIEAQTRAFREKHMDTVMALDGRLRELKMGGIKGEDWHGNSIGDYRSLTHQDLLLSLQLICSGPDASLSDWQKWNQEGLQNIRQFVEAAFAGTEKQKQQAWEELRTMKVAGESVALGDSRLNNFKALFIGGQRIDFPDENEASAGKKWALENGAYETHHLELGEQWRDVAKVEEWSERQSRLANCVLKGGVLTKGSYSTSVPQHESYMGKNGSRVIGSTKRHHSCWEIGGVSLRPDGYSEDHPEKRWIEIFAARAGVGFVNKADIDAHQETLSARVVEHLQTLPVCVEIHSAYSKRGQLHTTIEFGKTGAFEEAIAAARKHWESGEKPYKAYLSIRVAGTDFVREEATYHRSCDIPDRILLRLNNATVKSIVSEEEFKALMQRADQGLLLVEASKTVAATAVPSFANLRAAERMSTGPETSATVGAAQANTVAAPAVPSEEVNLTPATESEISGLLAKWGKRDDPTPKGRRGG